MKNNNDATELEKLQRVASAARDCISDTRHMGGEVSFMMGGHRRIRLADALAALVPKEG